MNSTLIISGVFKQVTTSRENLISVDGKGITYSKLYAYAKTNGITIKELVVRIGDPELSARMTVYDEGIEDNDYYKYSHLLKAIEESDVKALEFFEFDITNFYAYNNSTSEISRLLREAKTQPVLDYLFQVACREYQNMDHMMAEFLRIGIWCNQPVSKLIEIKNKAYYRIADVELIKWFLEVPDEIMPLFIEVFGKNEINRKLDYFLIEMICKLRWRPAGLKYTLSILGKLTDEQYIKVFSLSLFRLLYPNEILDSLIQSGMKETITDAENKNYSLLHLVGESSNDNGCNMVTLLIEKGVNVNVLSVNGQTPLDVANKHHNSLTASYLKEAGGLTADELRSESNDQQEQLQTKIIRKFQ